jgi:hypothetical protein
MECCNERFSNAVWPHFSAYCAWLGVLLFVVRCHVHIFVVFDDLELQSIIQNIYHIQPTNWRCIH